MKHRDSGYQLAVLDPASVIRINDRPIATQGRVEDGDQVAIGELIAVFRDAPAVDSGESPEWFIRTGQVIQGPFTRAKLSRYAAEGRLRSIHRVSTNRITWRSPADIGLDVDDDEEFAEAELIEDSAASYRPASASPGTRPDASRPSGEQLKAMRGRDKQFGEWLVGEGLFGRDAIDQLLLLRQKKAILSQASHVPPLVDLLREHSGLGPALVERFESEFQAKEPVGHQAEFDGAVVRAIDALPPAQRAAAQAFILTYEDCQGASLRHQPMAQMAGAILGHDVDAAQVKANWQQAKRKIRDYLVKQGFVFVRTQEVRR